MAKTVFELKEGDRGGWWHRIEPAPGRDPIRAGSAAGWHGPYKTKGAAKGAARQRFRNRPADQFEWKELPKE